VDIFPLLFLRGVHVARNSLCIVIVYIDDVYVYSIC
jgi:hypothetical protein